MTSNAKKIGNIFAKRRKIFLSQIEDNSVTIIPNRSTSISSGDVGHKYKVDSDFYYLTGFEEPNSICVLKKEKKGFAYILFIEGRDKEKEIWIGRRVGKEDAKSIYKADESYLISQFDEKLKGLIQGRDQIYYALGKNKELDLKITNVVAELRKSNRSGINFPKSISDPAHIIYKMRIIKDDYEISCIQKAADISKCAHILAMAYARAGIYEYELEAIIEYKFRTLGANGPAYPSIVGSGKNSTILHYMKNNRKIQKDDLVLIDAGSEYNYYASDLTRTFPASKKFSGLQKDIYEIVLEAQEKAIEQIKPGKRFIDSYNKAVLVIVQGLKELKLLKGSTGEIIEKGKYKKFFMHRIGHWLGLDVHDAGPYVDALGNSIKLVQGMVLTVEPGIYIANNLVDVQAGFRGIGIRIEDDVLVTARGNKILSSGTPKTVKEIEALG